MLKVEVGNGEMKILAMGNVVELTADVGVTIKVIYDNLKNEGSKEFFIESLKSFIDEGLYKMNDKELEELNKKKMKEAEEKKKGEAKKKVKEKEDFKNDIKTLIDLMKKVVEKQ